MLTVNRHLFPAYTVMCIYAQLNLQRKKYMEIRHFGSGRRQSECARILSERLAHRGGRLLLLPIPTTRDNKYISGSSVRVADIADMPDGQTYVVGYNIPTVITDRAGEVGAFVYDGAEDEEFLCENAELTARGALGYLLTHSERDLSELNIGVVGYGRIGIRMMRLLLLLGAKPTVYTTRSEVAVSLGEMGISACLIGDSPDYSTLDILINTAPARQIDESELPYKTEIIDLASGSIFKPSERLTKLASIPDGMYPLTAGRLYAEAALRALGGDR